MCLFTVAKQDRLPQWPSGDYYTMGQGSERVKEISNQDIDEEKKQNECLFLEASS
jgi:hypothetical protein